MKSAFPSGAFAHSNWTYDLLRLTVFLEQPKLLRLSVNKLVDVRLPSECSQS